MPIDIQLSPNFKKEAKKLIKKYPSLKTELTELYDILLDKPDTGTSLGQGVYKVRLGIASKSTGKSGGARVMTFYKIDENSLLLFSIYSKGKKENISDKEIQMLLTPYR